MVQRQDNNYNCYEITCLVESHSQDAAVRAWANSLLPFTCNGMDDGNEEDLCLPSLFSVCMMDKVQY